MFQFKEIAIAIFIFIVLPALFVVHRIETEPGYETVLIQKPYLFGRGGVMAATQKPGAGWYVRSTTGVSIPTAPIKIDEPLDHLATIDNNFINYLSYIVIKWTDINANAQQFGVAGWYETNMKEQYRTIVRDVTKQYRMTDIMTDQETLQKIESEITKRFNAHIASTGLRVALLNVNMGKALPDPAVIVEMNNTAVQQQRIKSEQQRSLAEGSRADAERKRAEADNAYRLSMQLNQNQFVQLEQIKLFSAACQTSKSCVIVQGNTPVMIGN